jgi:putative aminopeptidase FrvX
MPPAFAELMRHIERIDGDHRTVLMVQVENEVGLLGASRDHSYPANVAFTTSVPPEGRSPMSPTSGTPARRPSICLHPTSISATRGQSSAPSCRYPGDCSSQ